MIPGPPPLIMSQPIFVSSPASFFTLSQANEPGRVVRRRRVNSLTTSQSSATCALSNATVASSSFNRTMSDCPKVSFRPLMVGLDQPQRNRDAVLMDVLDHLLHNLPTSNLQWALAGSRQEPHPFIFVAAINNIDAVACQRVMERRGAVFSDKSEECLSPRIVDISKDLLAQLFEFLRADWSD